MILEDYLGEGLMLLTCLLLLAIRSRVLRGDEK